MIPPFEEMLEHLIDQSIEDYDLETIISALELKLAALKEQQAEEGGE